MFSRKSDIEGFLKENRGLFTVFAAGATTALYLKSVVSHLNADFEKIKGDFEDEKVTSASLYARLNEAFDSLNDDFQRLDANFETEENKQQSLWGGFDDEMEGNKSRYAYLSRGLGKLNVKLNKANAPEKPGVYDSESDTPDAPFDNIVHDS